MKITGLSVELTESVILAFEDFKKHWQSKSRKSFSYDNFVSYINSKDYDIVAYKWHEDESELERNNYGKKAVCIYNVFSAFSGSSSNLNLKDDKNQIVLLIKKTDKNNFEFI